MNIEIKSSTTIDSTKVTKIRFCDSSHNISVLLKGVSAKDLEVGDRLAYVHRRLISLIHALDSRCHQEPITHITFEIA